MKRQIIFRGQSLANGEWMEGNLFVKGGRCTITDDCSCYSVDPETVGQWTGFTDVNGRKIFEGDILKDLSEIRWFDKMGGFSQYSKGFYSIGVGYWVEPQEVIGNIHDNPELLKTE